MGIIYLCVPFSHFVFAFTFMHLLSSSRIAVTVYIGDLRMRFEISNLRYDFQANAVCLF